MLEVCYDVSGLAGPQGRGLCRRGFVIPKREGSALEQSDSVFSSTRRIVRFPPSFSILRIVQEFVLQVFLRL